ncbi:PWWP domain-containing protein [Heracleum sosnowskyi]|uniref:PWWP domain-containing protein n=1 Tax=Heracleum sosnowskyi TaxID=360622 RepID=A0AAD8J7N9_9APIA|nr:PWWP domain-containing protein [Heracleum sosnowskyi]
MGSSDTGTSTGVADCSVGAIVWVRRRNGSWWPGKILGDEDLSGSHVLSPRSGTPVKLLGREDASVDWYNMEKSKRVKAFRCGEFDDCIDKAESSLGMPPKKREKYARREDAIIHALELEKQFLEKQYGKLGSSSNYKSSKSSDDVKKELATSAESLRHGNGKCVDPKYKLSGEVDLPHKGITSAHLQTQKVKVGKQLSGDDVNSDVLPRMRGLQDIGLKTASSKRKIPLVDSNGPLKSPLYESSRAPLNGSGASTGNTGDANDKAFPAKRKRSNEGLAGDSIVKRRDKCRPLVQVLESSAMFQVPPSLKAEDSIVSLHANGEEQTGVKVSAKRSKHVDQTKSSESTDDSEIHPKDVKGSPLKLEDKNNPPADPSGSTEDTETDSSETDSLESDTDEEMADISDESIEFRPKSIVKSDVQEEDGIINTEEPDDPATTSDTSHPSNDDILASVGVSKWIQKRKRNTRPLTKRYLDISGGKIPRAKCKGKGSYGSEEMDLLDNKYGTLVGGYGSRGIDGIGHNISSWGGSIEHKIPVSAGRRFGDRRKCTLVDVDLKVQSNYQREHVPMISLMSKINGQAIVGHPIQIETLEFGSVEALLAAASDELNEDPDTSLPPMWRTARRTANCRVPRPRSSSMLDGDEGTEHLQNVHQDRKAPTNRSNRGKKSMRKSSGRGSRPTDKKLLKNPAKKTGVASNQKTRTLASIATQQKPNNHLKHGSSSCDVNGPVKSESVSTAGACIPVKLVFSRLLEDLGGSHQ